MVRRWWGGSPRLWGRLSTMRCFSEEDIDEWTHCRFTGLSVAWVVFYDSADVTDRYLRNLARNGDNRNPSLVWPIFSTQIGI
jgi:hypothetical protein